MKLLGILQKILFLILLVLFPLFFWLMLTRLMVFLPSFDPVTPYTATTTVTVVAGTGSGGAASSTAVYDPLAGKGVPEKTSVAPKTVNAPAVKDLPSLSASQVAGDGALTRQGIVEQTNKQRLLYLGAGYELKENAQLSAAAAAKVKDMFNGQYFEHVSPAGKDATYFISAAGYDFIAIGENLAKGGYTDDADVVQAWMASPGHRENILKAGYKEIGVAVGYGNFGGKKTWLAVQEFGVPRSSCPEIDAALSKLIDDNKAQLDSLSAEQKKLYDSINQQKDNIETLEQELAAMAGQWKSNGELKAKKSELEQAVNAVNRDIDAYNSINVQIKSAYDVYKAHIDQYNVGVAAFNGCVEALE